MFSTGLRRQSGVQTYLTGLEVDDFTHSGSATSARVEPTEADASGRVSLAHFPPETGANEDQNTTARHRHVHERLVEGLRRVLVVSWEDKPGGWNEAKTTLCPSTTGLSSHARHFSLRLNCNVAPQGVATDGVGGDSDHLFRATGSESGKERTEGIFKGACAPCSGSV